jgi:hypothetical protein
MYKQDELEQDEDRIANEVRSDSEDCLDADEGEICQLTKVIIVTQDQLTRE